MSTADEIVTIAPSEVPVPWHCETWESAGVRYQAEMRWRPPQCIIRLDIAVGGTLITASWEVGGELHEIWARFDLIMRGFGRIPEPSPHEWVEDELIAVREMEGGENDE